MMICMNWRRCFLVRRFHLTAGLLLFCLMLWTGAAADDSPSAAEGATDYHMAGIRLGAWIDQGGKTVNADINTDLSDVNFYTELYYDHRLFPTLFMEFSLGIASRGDAVVIRDDTRYIGTINVYTILIQGKYAPLAGRLGKWSPFILAGGGFAFGKHNVDVISGYIDYYDYYDAQKSEVDIMGVVGGGLDLALSRHIGLNLITKYHPIKFGEELAGVRDFSGLSVSVGLTYFLYKKGN